MANRIRYFDVRMEFEEIDWEQLTTGIQIYYYIKYFDGRKTNPETAYGPFMVVDPTQRRLRNMLDVEVNFGTNIQPLLPTGRLI